LKEHKISILTPESVEFDFYLADVGSRFIAIFIDTLIQLLISLPVMALIYLIRMYWWFSHNPDHISPWLVSILLLILSVAGFSGYHIFFESFWNGRTPGKLITRIRVVKDGGFPVNISSSFIRNLIRIIDFLPFYYSMGVISILLSGNKKRLGDIVAGTIVIREYGDILPPVIDTIEKQGGKCLNLSPLCLEKLTSEEYILLREFILRKSRLEKSAEKKLSEKISFPLMEKLGINKTEWHGKNMDFLEELLLCLRANEKFL